MKLRDVILIYLSGIGVVLTQNSAINLRRDIFKSYDPQSRPVENSSQVTNICVGLYILQIVGLSEKSQVMQANIQLLFRWVSAY
jgi:hypothetical protein